MRKILITEPFRKEHTDRIQSAVGNSFMIGCVSYDCDNDMLAKELSDAEIVIGQPPVALLQNPEENCPKLRLVQMTWAGTDIYTRSSLPFPKNRVMLANASGAYGMVMSQYVAGMLLSVMLRFGEYHEQQKNRIWKRLGPVRSLDGARVIIFGAGDIGTAVARRLSGFGAYCIGVCRNTEKDRPYFDELCVLADAEKYLPDADVVIGCIPADEQTEGYMNENRLRALKRDAVIVNVGRGSFIDCIALDTVLNEGHLWGAALDVTSPEPLPTDHPLWSNTKCMITPHTSGTTFGQLKETEDLVCDIVCSNLSAYCRGEKLKNRIY